MRIAACMAIAAYGAAAFAADWQAITPDTNLADWHSHGGNWRVDDGEVVAPRAAGEDAWLISDKAYADFDLTLEFKSAGTAGFYFRAHALPAMPLLGTAPQTDAKSIYGYRVATSDQGVSFSLDQDAPIVESTDVGSKPGEWNTLVVSATGDSISVKLNGTAVVDERTVSYSSGSIALSASPDADVRFRNVKIQDRGRDGEWRSLFNGENIDGWEVWGEEEWVVLDGIIEGRSGPKKSEGYLLTKDSWKDFHARGSFKMLGEGNYGLFFHSSVSYNDEKFPIISGVQGEVAPGYPSNSGCIYESYKRGWLVEPDMTIPGAYALREGEWNEIEIKCVGNRTITWINGVNVVDFEDATPNCVEGGLALQLHTGGVQGVQWKDLFVNDLKSDGN